MTTSRIPYTRHGGPPAIPDADLRWDHTPPPEGTFAVLLYGTSRAEEYWLPANTADAIERARFEAQWHFAPNVAVRDHTGTVLLNESRLQQEPS